jgi:hypothetical protein
MTTRARGRPPAQPLAGDTPITAPGVTPVVTAAAFARLGERLGFANDHDGQVAFAEALGISYSYLRHLVTGRRQLGAGPLLVLLVDRMRQHRVTLGKG